jgi:uncharacterized protein (DUF2164 family)
MTQLTDLQKWTKGLFLTLDINSLSNSRLLAIANTFELYWPSEFEDVTGNTNVNHLDTSDVLEAMRGGYGQAYFNQLENNFIVELKEKLLEIMEDVEEIEEEVEMSETERREQLVRAEL